ncbi:MAG TPA: hypothetical protein VG269_02210 [Tepidisphaeraceae bacterium]|jgi:hypothetical protein|nr:hypothetical protein [Tepidisphaeraceae bacterium]
MGKTKIAVGAVSLALVAGAVVLSMIKHSPRAHTEAAAQGGSPVPERPPGGLVRTPAGIPVPRAEVLLVGTRTPLDLYDQSRPKAPLMKTDDDGRFTFDPTEKDWKAIVVRCSEGFACVGADELPAGGEIVVSPWGRIEGKLRAPVGSPVAGRVQIQSWEFGDEYAGLGVSFRREVPLSPDGHFVIPRVAPGEVRLNCYLEAPGGQRNLIMNVWTAYAAVVPGQTALVTFGEPGIRVKGRAVFTPAGDTGVRLAGTVARAAQGGGTPKPSKWKSMTRGQRATWRALQGQTSEGRAANEARLTRAFAVDGEGRFRIGDVPAGANRIRLTAYSIEPGSTSRDVAGSAEKSFMVSIPLRTDGSGEIDLGDVELKPRRWLKRNTPAPALELLAADSSRFRLSDFRGKQVLLVIAAGEGAANPGPPFTGDAIADHFGGPGGIVLVRVAPDKAAFQSSPAGHSAWRDGYFDDGANIPEEYADPNGLACLIGADGMVKEKFPMFDRAIYFGLDVMQPPGCSGAEGVQVVAEHNYGTAGTTAFKFPTVPTISKVDAGQRAIFSIVDGQKADYGGGLGVLNDGLGPRTFDDESLMMAFDNMTLEGRLGADLGRVIAVDQINTYSWYKHGNRYPQVYRVYGSAGTGADFNPTPKIGTDPARCGWTPIASVDTRQTAGGVDLRDGMIGQDGVSIRGGQKEIGKYRYLLFLVFATEPHDQWCQTFWSEIDVVERK